MPQVEIRIGGRAFDVACQDGEEHFLKSAAAMLDEEASALSSQVGRMPEARMLLMAGLMLADKTAGLQDRVNALEAAEAKLQSRVTELESAPEPEARKVEVPVIPSDVTDTLAEIAAQAEALADEVEEASSK